MEIRSIVLAQLTSIVDQFSPFPIEVHDETLLDELGLDSVAFTSLLVGLERELGFIPSGILQGLLFPETVGELIETYENEAALV